MLDRYSVIETGRQSDQHSRSRGKSMTHINLRWVAFGMALCACGAVETPTAMAIQPGINMQGINMQGINMQGINMQGMAMHGFLVDGAKLGGVVLNSVHVDRGEV